MKLKMLPAMCRLKRNAHESKLRTIAWERAFQTALRSCSKEVGGGRGSGGVQYICDFDDVGVHKIKHTFLLKVAAASLTKTTISHEKLTSQSKILVLFLI